MIADFQRDYALVTDYVIYGSARKLDNPERTNFQFGKLLNDVGKLIFLMKKLRSKNLQ